jgi:hypothetical protein
MTKSFEAQLPALVMEKMIPEAKAVEQAVAADVVAAEASA